MYDRYCLRIDSITRTVTDRLDNLQKEINKEARAIIKERDEGINKVL